ncbi:DUF2059 domain-containing protein [Moraxella nonliquefaciens]|uniref:DUF2059 domain-containing protein n=1 Tax=Moraxella nonliquefaciens TaxID=478 RepID=A0A1B8PN42_MORNO|nr:DUF2059 domain-containing protein [Moraxella nonliquefaciens]OBX52472.1 hypothetical protein A9Z60_02105 [Moraxella nonliquefaciens]
MKIKLLLLLSGLCCASAFATPSNQSLEELAKIMPYESTFYQAIVAPLEMERMAIAQGMAQDNTLTDEQRKKALNTFDAYAEGLIKTLDTKAVKDGLKKSYLNAAKSFNQAEVDTMIAFYGSKDGQSALKKEDAVFESYMKSAGENNQKIIEDYEKKHLNKLQDDIKKILKK